MSQMIATQRLAEPILAIVLLTSSWGFVQAQAANIQYFPETGHNVKGEVLQFYIAAKDPKLVYGYPITEEIVSKDGKTVQYFQRARFELHPELPDRQRVQLTPIGQVIYRQGGQLNIDNPFGCRTFPTGYRVCFAFLDFFNANGGLTQFGNPISPFEYHDNLVTQYFEKARFEWHGDRPEGQRVSITDLGRVYFDQLGEDPVHLKAVDPLDATIRPVLSLHPRAFTLKAVTLSSGQQTIFIILQDQTLAAVKGASGKATVRWPDGQREEYAFTTNSAGIGTVGLNFANQPKGELVYIDIAVSYQGLTAKTMTSFRIWF